MCIGMRRPVICRFEDSINRLRQMNQLFCLEVIDHNSVRIFTDIDKARLWLNQRIAPIRLDYHGVLDLVPPGSVLPTDGPM